MRPRSARSPACTAACGDALRGSGKPGPGADVGGVGPGPGYHVGSGKPGPGYDVGGVGPSPGPDLCGHGRYQESSAATFAANAHRSLLLDLPFPKLYTDRWQVGPTGPHRPHDARTEAPHGLASSARRGAAGRGGARRGGAGGRGAMGARQRGTQFARTAPRQCRAVQYFLPLDAEMEKPVMLPTTAHAPRCKPPSNLYLRTLQLLHGAALGGAAADGRGRGAAVAFGTTYDEREGRHADRTQQPSLAS